jgi:hypothetical protein
MAKKMGEYGKGVNKPIPRAPRINVSPTLDFPNPGKATPMRKIPLKKGGK